MNTQTEGLLDSQYIIVGIDMKGQIKHKAFFDDKDRHTDRCVREHIGGLNSTNGGVNFYAYKIKDTELL